MNVRSFAVLGLGRFGSSMAETLHRMGYEVMAIDNCEECVNDISDIITHAVQGDVTDEGLLKSLGIRNFDVAIIAIGDDIQASIMATLIVKEAGVKYVVAKAQSDLHSKVLLKVGADRVVFPEKDMAVRVAYHFLSTNVLDLIELSPNYSVVETTPPGIWVGKTLDESKIRAKYGISIIAVKNDSAIIVTPKADYVIKKDDILVIIGSNSDIKKLGGL